MCLATLRRTALHDIRRNILGTVRTEVEIHVVLKAFSVWTLVSACVSDHFAYSTQAAFKKKPMDGTMKGLAFAQVCGPCFSLHLQFILHFFGAFPRCELWLSNCILSLFFMPQVHANVCVLTCATRRIRMVIGSKLSRRGDMTLRLLLTGWRTSKWLTQLPWRLLKCIETRDIAKHFCLKALRVYIEMNYPDFVLRNRSPMIIRTAPVVCLNR
jgi:hypothetical protein